MVASFSFVSNRGWDDGEDPQALAQKVRHMATGSPHSFTSNLTDMERGWAVVTCYIRPMGEVGKGGLTRLGAEEVRGVCG